MTTDQIETKATAIVSTALMHQPNGLNDSTHLIKTGALDSLGIMEISQGIKREFDIKIDNADINPRNFSTMAGIKALIQRYVDINNEQQKPI